MIVVKVFDARAHTIYMCVGKRSVYELYWVAIVVGYPVRATPNSLANQLDIYLILAKQEKLASNSLTNQLDIHLILAKQGKLASNSLANQLGKNRNLTKLTSPRAYMHARIVVAISVSL
jgi:hypothetical protein